MRAVLLCHAVCGLAAVGALTHHALWSLRARARPGLRAQSRRYARWAALLCLLQVGLGATLARAVHPGAGLAVALRLKIGAALGALGLALVALALAGPGAAAPARWRSAPAVLAALCGWLAAVVGLALVAIGAGGR